MQNGFRYMAVSGGLLALLAVSIPGIGADAAKANRANYELASRWTPAKIGKLVFDTAVTPHWMDSGDRFWYSFENNSGRKFYVVDPSKKTRSLVFDPTRLAAALTTATGLPYDGQHLPITVIRFVRNEGSMQFEINVPRDAVIPGEKKSTAAAEDRYSARLRGATRSSSPSSTNSPRASSSCWTSTLRANQRGPISRPMTGS
jgi:dipeptidyl-peptidase 4